MKTERLSKLKSVALASVMLVFAMVVMLGGVAVGDEQNNDEQPILLIEKTIISGNTVVPIRTQVFWELEIRVTNTGGVALDAGIVKDTLPAYIELISTTESAGSVTTTSKKGATKVIWTIGVLAPGVTETLTMEIATAEKNLGGRRRGMTTYYFLDPGEYSLNKGAIVTAVDLSLIAEGMGYMGMNMTAGPTDEIIVYAEYKRMGRMGGMGGGMGGRWR